MDIFPSKKLFVLMVIFSMVIGYSSCSSDSPTTSEPPQPPEQDHSLFQAGISYQAGDAPVSIFSTDLNGDGSNDLVTANFESDSVSVLLNKTNN